MNSIIQDENPLSEYSACQDYSLILKKDLSMIISAQKEDEIYE